MSIGGRVNSMHQRRSSAMSTYPTLLEPVCRRRQLPPTPVSPIRRASSPRMLPTPPPFSPLNISPIPAEFRCPSANMERRSSGRILPRPPTTADSSIPSSNHTSPSPIPTPEPIPELPVEVDADVEEAPESPVIQRFGDFTSLDHDTPDGTRSQSSSLSPSIEQVGTTPPPLCS
ncbi:unnamed protein product [Cylicocyclus nassatus]|uniref:Uncharacterized protein n=1 Tax=Cylicocyclus nassatus TaxID=53992 RepID=A0AA36GNA4_CYLNA|nr:unnamed protein product [Cylicocyclus nassatus]